ncbi:DUF6907 domain-containing protein [Nocardia farcinica]|uniref:DUF6907 domain-containing protein n=1 Tax=Nocardia farcinica TaxID=37329 RepID=UPI001896158C|nr:hypothetical protein [Nocardia farcinica]MBF6233775.1 hypothetical protein [Nocardia farcinica]MBF6522237.1 hypothetical protein [Nocardia farcinica]
MSHTVPELPDNPNHGAFNPGDPVRLPTISLDGKLDGGHLSGVLDHIGSDGFARIRVDGIAQPLVVGVDRLVPDPIRPCPPWCDNPNRHDDELPVDRSCWSTDRSIALNRDRWGAGLPTIVDTGAQLRAGDTEALVLISLRGGAKDLGLRLTPWEARRLAADLNHFADLIEGRE